MEIDWLNLLQTLGGMAGGLGLGFWTKSGRIKAQADAYKAQADAYEFRIKAMNDQLAIYDEMERKHAQRISDLNEALDLKEQYHTEREDRLYADIDSLHSDIRRMRDAAESEYRECEQEINRINALLVDAKDREVQLTQEKGELEVELARKRCDDIDCPWRRPPTADTPPQPGISRDQWHSIRLEKES